MSAEAEIAVIRPDRDGWTDRSDAPIFAGAVSALVASVVAQSIRGMAGEPVQASIVRFEPGSHTRLHTHEADQILVITEGSGHVGRPGRDELVTTGCLIVIPAGVEHYHGACSDSPMAHLTVLAGSSTTLSETEFSWPPVRA